MKNKLLPTSMPYYLLVSERHLWAKTEKMYLTASYYTQPQPDEDAVATIKETKKPVLLLQYNTSEENDLNEIQQQPIGDTGCTLVTYNIYGTKREDGTIVHTIEEAAGELQKIIVDMERRMLAMGLFRAEDYNGRCGHCRARISIEDRYCRFCGTKRGESDFQPDTNEFYCVYGPPIKTKLICEACGYKWENHCLGTDRSKYCPQCGSKTILKVSKTMLI